MVTTLQNDIIKTFKILNETIALFSEKEFNISPEKETWTAGQIVQHLVLSCSGYPKLFKGKTQTTNRKPDEYIKLLENIFLDFNTKMDSPEFIRPKITNYSKNTLTLSLLDIEADLLSATETYNLTLTCLDFQLTGFEKFTILEWITFALVHIQRHTRQLADIFLKIKTIHKN